MMDGVAFCYEREAAVIAWRKAGLIADPAAVMSPVDVITGSGGQPSARPRA